MQEIPGKESMKGRKHEENEEFQHLNSSSTALLGSYRCVRT